MNEVREKAKISLSWIRANVKTLLLAADGLLVLVLLYMFISQAVFEVRTRALLAKTADLGRKPDRPSPALVQRPPVGRPPVPMASGRHGPAASTSSLRAADSRSSVTSGPATARGDARTTGSVSTDTSPTSGSRPSTPSVPGRFARGFRPRGRRFPPPGRPHSSRSGGADDVKKREAFALLEKRALFGGSRPPGKRPPQLEAILGDAALVNGKWVKVGDRIGEEKIVEIATEKIVIEDAEGKRHEVVIKMEAPGLGPPTHPGPSPRRGKSVEGQGGGEGGPNPAIEASSKGKRPREERGGRPPRHIPDWVFERLTRPGGRFEGKSREEIEQIFRERMRKRRERRPPPGRLEMRRP